METIIKAICEVLLGAKDENGNYSQTRIQRLKDGILWMIVGIAIFVVAVIYLVDDIDGEEDGDYIEVVGGDNYYDDDYNYIDDAEEQGFDVTIDTTKA